MTKKNVLISGGSRGLGFELVKRFSASSNVTVLSRKKHYLKNNINHHSVDLSNYNSALKVFKNLRKKIKKFDTIICCTGSGKKISNDEINKKVLEEYFDINFYTVSNLISSYLKTYNKQKTSIIVISSIASKKIIEAPIGYSISKLSLDYLVKILAKNLAKNQINLNLISPGNILINNNSWDKRLKNNKAKTKKYINQNVPTKSFVSASEIFNIIQMILKSDSKNITGSDFIVDGGQSL